MVKISELRSGAALQFTFPPRPEDKDLRRVVTAVELALEDHDEISLLFDLVNLDEAQPGAVLERLMSQVASFGRAYRLRRVAVLAGHKWESLLGLESSLLPKVEVRIFPADDEPLARDWVSQPTSRPDVGLVLTERESFIRGVVSNKVSGHDVRRLCKAIRMRYEQQGPVNLLTMVEGWPGAGPGLPFEKLKAFDCMKLVGKHAVVAPSWAEPVLCGVVGALRGVRYFPREALDEAGAWLATSCAQVEVVEQTESFLAVRLPSPLTQTQVEQLYHHLKANAGSPELGLLLELPYDPGHSLNGVLWSLRLALEERAQPVPKVRRLAIVTDPRWCPTDDLSTHGRLFPFSERDRAVAWLASSN